MPLPLLLVGVLVVVLFAVRAALPSDFRINKVYLRKYLKDNDGQGPKSVVTRKLEMVLQPDTPEERVYYHVQARFSNGDTREALIQVFYPLEVFHQEKEKRDKARHTEEMNPNAMTSMGSPMSSSDMEKYREDPFKDLSEEERVKAAKEKEIFAEVKQLKLLSVRPTVFPELIAFDPAKHITITEPIGSKRLDDLLNGLPVSEKEELLMGLVRDLAQFHDQGEKIALQLLPGSKHDEVLIQSQLMSSFDTWPQLGVPFTNYEREELSKAIEPLYKGVEEHMGPKVGDCSPRSFFVNAGRAKSPEWGKARKDISAIDIVELICDPVVGLPAEAEERLIAQYVDSRSLSSSEKEQLKLVTSRLAVYYRLALLSYLGQYFKALQSMGEQKRKSFQVKYWSLDALPRAIENLLFYLESDEELQDLYVLLKDKFPRLGSA
jgi:aminoglycoside/choline kinase family phosphotransferase